MQGCLLQFGKGSTSLVTLIKVKLLPKNVNGEYKLQLCLSNYFMPLVKLQKDKFLPMNSYLKAGRKNCEAV